MPGARCNVRMLRRDRRGWWAGGVRERGRAGRWHFTDAVSGV